MDHLVVFRSRISNVVDLSPEVSPGACCIDTGSGKLHPASNLFELFDSGGMEAAGAIRPNPNLEAAPFEG
jgi:hypothetical protein